MNLNSMLKPTSECSIFNDFKHELFIMKETNTKHLFT